MAKQKGEEKITANGNRPKMKANGKKKINK